MIFYSVDKHPCRRPQSRSEFVADSCVHAVGIGVALVGALILVGVTSFRGDLGKVAAISIYGFGMILMFAASAAYNIFYASRWRPVLRRCDHAAIFLMIAGTYTPFTTQLHTGLTAAFLTCTIWSVCGVGIAIKIFAPDLFEKIAVGIYLGLGWASVAVLAPLVGGLALTTLVATVIGGALYSVGVLFHCWDNLKFQNAIWHVFVLMAAAAHYVAIFTGVVFTQS